MGVVYLIFSGVAMRVAGSTLPLFVRFFMLVFGLRMGLFGAGFLVSCFPGIVTATNLVGKRYQQSRLASRKCLYARALAPH